MENCREGKTGERRKEEKATERKGEEKGKAGEGRSMNFKPTHANRTGNNLYCAVIQR